jgi:hypothetical protein
MNRKLFLVLLAAALLVLTAAFPLVAGASHSWGNYHWPRSSNPVVLDVGDNVSGDWVDHLGGAIADWNVSSVLSLNIVPGQSKGNCKGTDGQIEVCAKEYGYNGWLGLAQIWASGDHITQATAKMNDSYFNVAPYNTPEWRQMVMCQEVGHDFGLDHQDEDFNNPNLDTCMDYTSNPASNQHPNLHDYQQLEAIYTHLDGSDGGGGGGGCNPRSPKCNPGNGVPSSGLDHPSDWGQIVRENGRTAVYERDFGNGVRLITFVIWAD